jgi:drug/metabolite transporter (DMT)-like permease
MWFFFAMLGNVLWSISDVVVSMIINRIERSSVMVTWMFSFIQLVILGVLYVILPIEHIWVGVFALSAFSSYLATLSFLKLLQTVDVSVSSVAWVFLSIGVAVGGVFLFGDTWTALQGIGATMSVLGALSLALWHKRIDRLQTLILLFTTGILFVPTFLVQKSAYLEGISVISVMFWTLLFYDLYALCYPLLMPSRRKRIKPFLSSMQPIFIGMILIWVLLSMVSFWATTFAYKLGDASLVGITENGQPFFLILFAWIATKLSPKYAPKEILTSQSIGIKIVSFIVVFTGLGLLAI